jgi:hypothetical protein
MKRFHVRVIGGNCGHKMIVVADHIQEVLAHSGYDCKVSTQSIWETMSMPPAVDLILQLLPAFSEDEGECPILYIKPLLADLDDPETWEKILATIKIRYEVEMCV